jgi:hypothetical protein
MKISEEVCSLLFQLKDLKCRLLLLFGFVFVFESCEKVTNVKFVDSPATGKLNYTIVDDSGKGLSKVKVLVYRDDAKSDINFLEQKFFVDSMRTDADGMAIFFDLVPGNFKLIVDSTTVNNVKYNIREMVQVVAGKEKKKVTKPSEFVGSLDIIVVSKSDYRTTLKGVQVVATPYSLNSTSANIRSMINAAYFKGTTDGKGFVSLKIPSNIPYYITTYNPESSAISASHEGYIIYKDVRNSLYFYTY